MAKRISVINFKGGVGKSALALHLGCYLADRRKKPSRVLLVDVDHQSTLSIIVMKKPKTWDSAVDANLTCNRIFTSFTTQGAQLPGIEIIDEKPLAPQYPTLDILPAQLELDDTEIELAATTIGNALASEWQKRTLLAKWLATSGVDDKYDFVVFDCPPATKIVSQNAIAASHAYVMPVIPDSISARGVTHFKNLVTNRIDTRMKGFAAAVRQSDIPSTFVPDTQLAGIVISMAQTHGPADSGYINEHTNIDRATGVAESLGNGWPVYWQGQNVNVTNRALPQMFDKVCEELVVSRLGW